MRKIKYFLSTFIVFISFFSFLYANKYIYFYQVGCGHCEKVDNFIEENGGFDKFGITKKEIRFNKNNKTEMDNYVSELGLSEYSVGTPFIVKIDYMIGDQPIIDHFSASELISKGQNGNSDSGIQIDKKQILGYGLLIIIVGIIGFFALSGRNK